MQRFIAAQLLLLLAAGVRYEDQVRNESGGRGEELEIPDWTEEELDQILAEVTAEDMEEDEDEQKDMTAEDLDQYLEEVSDYLDAGKEDAVFSEEEAEPDQDDEACTLDVKSTSVTDWLAEAQTWPSSGCLDFGPRFGSWGSRGCPKSLAEISKDFQSGSSKADGGKSGTKPLISQNFVVKVIDQTEHKQLSRLLQKLRGSRRTTFIVPTCRSMVFRVNGELHYLQIALNMRLRGVEEEPLQRLFDLKGNWLYRNRHAGIKEKVWKDGNFKNVFPHGLSFEQVKLPGGEDEDQVFTGEAARDLVAQTLHDDSKLLAGLGLMDYSLMLHVAKFRDVSTSLQEANINQPWAYAVKAFPLKQKSREELYAVSFGIIDILMHEEENRGLLNKFMSGITFSHCKVNDIDPIPARDYWIRFVRMLGLRLRYGAKCISCLKEKVRAGFTYFPNTWSGRKSGCKVEKA